LGKIVDDLRAEHAAMARLLDALERQVTVFRDGGAPDYDIVQGVTEYFCDFPELHHHPKEDLLARSLLDQAGGGAEALKGLAAQHEELAGLTRRFAKVVQRVLDEAELPRGATNLETWFIRGGSAGVSLYTFRQPGLYAYVNHNLIEALALGAAAHVQVEGEWNNDLMTQVLPPTYLS
jgi:hypothetical protein